MGKQGAVPDWKAYQEEAAEFFRSLGQKASTDVTVKGVRTEHDIDVLVKLDVAGFEVTWAIECKHWKNPVTKLHVLALREIVSDIGADRGIILCEAGFQSGAVEAATLTNVQVTSLSKLAVSSRDTIYAVNLRDIYDRLEMCRTRYWDIPKDVRIEKGLRFDLGDEHMYSGARVIDLCSDLLSQAFRSLYPIKSDLMYCAIHPDFPRNFDNVVELVNAIEPLVAELEDKLEAVK